MISPIFLGGTCGKTTWRTEIAIPILEAAGLPYFNPQLPEGGWTPEYQYVEMEVKDRAEIWLFVITADTRGIASIGEVAYRIGNGGKIALALEFIPEGGLIDGAPVSQKEADDINRGRIYLQAMAEVHGVPVFSNVADATHHTVALAAQVERELTLPRLQAILQRVQAPGFHFEAGRIADKFTVQIRQQVRHTQNGNLEEMSGRCWLIDPSATEDEVVRTLLKAALTWEEHEIRERFLFDGKPIFHPHFKLPPSDDHTPGD
ncbi:MAG: nucleoside 2-deoxyribosyltransferase domain-containing protein [Saprospiraceae bacterium]|nr:nucleoside 2-deoxyribosyltransferase domain-containing protein [Saprospiraceae bacterium]